jgi:ABC-2 type transport system ATP-binding protein
VSAATVQLSGGIENLLATHLMLSGPRDRVDAIKAAHAVVRADYAQRQASLMIRARGPVCDPAWTMRQATLEELILAYMSAPGAADPPGPRRTATATEVSP